MCACVSIGKHVFSVQVYTYYYTACVHKTLREHCVDALMCDRLLNIEQLGFGTYLIVVRTTGGIYCFPFHLLMITNNVATPVSI